MFIEFVRGALAATLGLQSIPLNQKPPSPDYGGRFSNARVEIVEHTFDELLLRNKLEWCTIRRTTIVGPAIVNYQPGNMAVSGVETRGGKTSWDIKWVERPKTIDTQIIRNRKNKFCGSI